MAGRNKNVAAFTSGGITPFFGSVDDGFLIPVFTPDGLWGTATPSQIGLGAGVLLVATVAAAAATKISRSITAVQTEWYATAGDLGGALYARVNSQPSHAGKFRSADGQWWELRVPLPNVRMFGAKGDGTTDDTTAIQNAVAYANQNAAATTRPRRMFFPAGNYAISSSIKLTGGNVVGLEIFGERLGTTITQTADNEAIFECTATSLCHTNYFGSLQVTWTQAPGAGKTKRSFLYMPSTGNTDFYNSTFERITFLRGNYFLRSVGPSFWGARVIELVVGGSTYGGVHSLIPDHQTGQPNSYYERLYIDCQNMVGPVFLASSFAVEMVAIELNQGNLGPAWISDTGGGQYNIGHIRSEVATYGATTSLINLPNGQLYVDTIEIATFTLNATVYLIEGNNNALSYFDIEQINTGNWTINGGGKFFFVKTLGNSNMDTPNRDCRIGRIYMGGQAVGETFGLTDVFTTLAADSVQVREWNDPARTSYVGDADKALAYDSATTQIWATALTATRNCALPNAFDYGLFSGRRFEITKTTTGQALNINSSGGGLIYQIPAANKGKVTLVWSRTLANQPAGFTWQVVEVDTWT